jgi:hypothetical protein
MRTNPATTMYPMMGWALWYNCTRAWISAGLDDICNSGFIEGNREQGRGKREEGRGKREEGR